jgi:regulation of enolase protein 1 (concanavalin A-like superfamily)
MLNRPDSHPIHRFAPSVRPSAYLGLTLLLTSCLLVSSPDLEDSDLWLGEEDIPEVDTLSLFESPGPVAEDFAWDAESGAKRSALGIARPEMLNASTSAFMIPGKFVRLNLFENVSLLTKVETVRPLGSNRFTSSGVIYGYPGSSFQIAATQGVMTATVRLPDIGLYRIELTASGRYRIIEASSFAPECPIAEFPEITDATDSLAGVGLQKRARRSSNAADTTIDIAFFFTDKALAAEPSLASLLAKIDLAVAEANEVYDSSDVKVRMRLVYRGPVVYKETGNISKDLSNLRNTTDKFMTEVHAIRDSVGADIVTLLTEGGSKKYAGLGYVLGQMNTAYSVNGFNVVRRPYMTGNHVLTHEVGHNMGLMHDLANKGSGSPIFPFAYGYKFASGGTTYYDVMAYPPGTQIGYFSNPDISYKGVAIGNASSADNARALDSSVAVVSQFRDSASATAVSMLAPLTGDTVAAGGEVLLSVNPANELLLSKVEYYHDSTLIGTETLSPFTHRWNVPDDTLVSYTIWAKAYSFVGGATVSDSVDLVVDTSVALPQGYADARVGVSGRAGITRFANSTFTQKVAGMETSGLDDNSQFAYKTLSGDFTYTARVQSFSGNAAQSAMAGIMVRDSLDAESAKLLFGYVAMQGKVATMTRTKYGVMGKIKAGKTVTLPYWFRVQRTGAVFTLSTSADGVKWAKVSAGKMKFGASALVGITSNSGASTQSAIATIDSVSQQ